MFCDCYDVVLHPVGVNHVYFVGGLVEIEIAGLDDGGVEIDDAPVEAAELEETVGQGFRAMSGECLAAC